MANQGLTQQDEDLLTSSKNGEKALPMYQELFDLAPDCYLVTDVSGVILQANQAAVELFGASKAALIGAPLAGWISEQDQLLYLSRTS